MPQFVSHTRDWRENFYVYPVISRRSRGLSIGVNLNPDMACNFDCIYCQVDRTVAPRTRTLELPRLESELGSMIEKAKSQALFDEPEFRTVPPDFRRINDIAFSGDGEPTTCRIFKECVSLAARLKRGAGLDRTKIVLITDACYLTRPNVAEGLRIMDENNGEIWAKLDAGTEAYYRQINKPNYSLSHVMENIIAAAKARPIVIQSLFMRVHDVPPSGEEIDAYIGRLREIVDAGGAIKLVQVYTVARKTAQPYVTQLRRDEVDAITERVKQNAGLAAESFYGPESD